jgi:hypothetical protein
LVGKPEKFLTPGGGKYTETFALPQFNAPATSTSGTTPM